MSLANVDRRNLRIVVVDDNRDAAAGIALLLKTTGFSVVGQVHNATKAIDCIKQEQPHVVILDIAMPGIDGYQIARRVRAEIKPSPRLVALTGFGTARDKQDATFVGFDAHFAKPVDWSELEKLLLTYLQQDVPGVTE